MTDIKICCISSLQEAQLALSLGANALGANALGANALGLVSAMPSGPGVIEESEIVDIIAALPSETNTLLLTSETAVDKIVEQHKRIPSCTIQLVDALIEGTYADLKKQLPNTRIVQVLHVLDESNIQEALEIAPQVDALLLDSGNPNLKVKELGGTGRTHNWEISAEIVKQVSVPVYLAGGLHAENVQEAIKQVRPFGVDLCSGVRTDGKLDEKKLKAFVTAVRSQ
ncbi:MAG: phosphoribosylanthranilate isomerase [Bacteroidota bacterium]